MSRKNNSGSINESAGWGLRLAALALTLLGVVVVFAFRFAGNGNQPAAIMWACAPILFGVLACMVLGKIKKLSSPKKKWQIYSTVLVLSVVGILVNTWFF